MDDFAGTLVHPQAWPEDLDYAGKRVVVIGSGATAVTLVPALAETAEHVTMLQRSPTYIASLPASEPAAQGACARCCPTAGPARSPGGCWRSGPRPSTSSASAGPKLVKKVLRKGLEQQLPAGYDIDTHFTPRYDPWDQRLCAVPDGDLFTAIRTGTRLGRHRPHRHVHRDGPAARVRRRARGRHHRHGHRARDAVPRRHRS